ncbi:unnamed protein product [Rotaria sordida]|uniref:Uncharacterized protein n=1 Tax=Rotaria sordida TaxID=392033 RepID=A0A814AHF3_9BILA|nr:unnamed protein product [Rotaria sordida]CAF4092441.1 unnamed protein product [Rotaria sordida]
MPSFKERFRPSRKQKKNKEADITSTNESINSSAASAISTNTSHILRTGRASLTTTPITPTAATTTTGKTIDEHTGSAAFSTYHSHHVVDQCE